MSKKVLRVSAAGFGAVSLFVTIAVPAGAAQDPTGIWLNDTGRGAIEITRCGPGLCGHVVWLKDPKDAEGCGRQILGDAVEVGRGTWDGGWIYSPERKRRFDVELKPIDNDRLQVTGYMGTKTFSQRMVWTRAPADLQTCRTEQAALGEPKSETKPGEALPPALPGGAPVPTPETTHPKSGQAPGGEARPPREERRTANLPIDRYFTKLPDGTCRVDTPWVQVTFPCEKR